MLAKQPQSRPFAQPVHLGEIKRLAAPVIRPSLVLRLPIRSFTATTQGLNDYNAAIAAFGSASSTDGGFTHQGTKANNPSGGFTMTLKRNGSNIGTYNSISGSITLNGAKPVPGDASGYIEWLYDYWSSFTLADPSVNTADRTYTADFTRSFGTGGSVQSQRISVTSTEW